MPLSESSQFWDPPIRSAYLLFKFRFERKREGQRELFFHLCMHSMVDSCYVLCYMRIKPATLAYWDSTLTKWTIQSGPPTFYFSGSSLWAFVNLCVTEWSLVWPKHAPSGSAAVLHLEGPGVAQPEWVSWLSVDSQSEHISKLWVPIPGWDIWKTTNWCFTLSPLQTCED